MGKLKSVEATVKRIITKVESGDYDEDILIHMVESIVNNRDKRIKTLEDRNRPRKFNLTEKKIAGALRNTIQEHGDITKQGISSAAKRIYGTCMELENTPARPDLVPNLTIGIIRDKNTTHKLTVASDGNIRIKIAIDSPEDEAEYIIKSFTDIGQRALSLGVRTLGTLRGKSRKGQKQDVVNSIILYTDSKKDSVTFTY